MSSRARGSFKNPHVEMSGQDLSVNPQNIECDEDKSVHTSKRRRFSDIEILSTNSDRHSKFNLSPSLPPSSSSSSSAASVTETCLLGSGIGSGSNTSNTASESNQIMVQLIQPCPREQQQQQQQQQQSQLMPSSTAEKQNSGNEKQANDDNKELNSAHGKKAKSQRRFKLVSFDETNPQIKEPSPHLDFQEGDATIDGAGGCQGDFVLSRVDSHPLTQRPYHSLAGPATRLSTEPSSTGSCATTLRERTSIRAYHPNLPRISSSSPSLAAMKDDGTTTTTNEPSGGHTYGSATQMDASSSFCSLKSSSVEPSNIIPSTSVNKGDANSCQQKRLTPISTPKPDANDPRWALYPPALGPSLPQPLDASVRKDKPSSGGMADDDNDDDEGEEGRADRADAHGEVVTYARRAAAAAISVPPSQAGSTGQSEAIEQRRALPPTSKIESAQVFLSSSSSSTYFTASSPDSLSPFTPIPKDDEAGAVEASGEHMSTTPKSEFRYSSLPSAFLEQQQEYQDQQARKKQQQEQPFEEAQQPHPQPYAYPTSNSGVPGAMHAGNFKQEELFRDWEVGERYELKRLLGSGSYGDVAEAWDCVMQRRVAIKRVDGLLEELIEAKRVYREMYILRMLRDSPEIVTLLDVFLVQKKKKMKKAPSSSSEHRSCQCSSSSPTATFAAPAAAAAAAAATASPSSSSSSSPPTLQSQRHGLTSSGGERGGGRETLYLVFEFVDTDLYKLILSPQYLTEEHIKSFLYQLLVGLKYIHSGHVIHRDLKPANLLLNEDCSLRICDFGLSRVVHSDNIFSASMLPAHRNGNAKEKTGGIVVGNVVDRVEHDEVSTGNIAQTGARQDCDASKAASSSEAGNFESNCMTAISNHGITTSDESDFFLGGGTTSEEETCTLASGRRQNPDVTHHAEKHIDEESAQKLDVETNQTQNDALESSDSPAASRSASTSNSSNLASDLAPPLKPQHGHTAAAGSCTGDNSPPRGSPPAAPPRPRPLKRQLTRHVVTRWYRGPELILLQDYTSAVDIWSVGCIFAELLSMQRESVPLYQNRAPLFPGRSCFPLSAETSNTYEDRKDQLNVIFAVIGTPSAEDIAALSDENAREYLHGLPRREPLNLAKVYSGASKAAISLLLGMLHFNPRKRITVNEALRHEFLADVRDLKTERTAEVVLSMDFFEEQLLAGSPSSSLSSCSSPSSVDPTNMHHDPIPMATGGHDISSVTNRCGEKNAEVEDRGGAVSGSGSGDSNEGRRRGPRSHHRGGQNSLRAKSTAMIREQIHEEVMHYRRGDNDQLKLPGGGSGVAAAAPAVEPPG